MDNRTLSTLDEILEGKPMITLQVCLREARIAEEIAQLTSLDVHRERMLKMPAVARESQRHASESDPSLTEKAPADRQRGAQISRRGRYPPSNSALNGGSHSGGFD